MIASVSSHSWSAASASVAVNPTSPASPEPEAAAVIDSQQSNGISATLPPQAEPSMNSESVSEDTVVCA